MKKVILYFILISIFSCNEKKIITMQEIRYIIITLDKTPFSQEVDKKIYCIGKDKKVYELSYKQLKRLYLDKYQNSYKDMGMFFYDAINQKVLLSFYSEIKYNYYNINFKLKSNIVDLYKKEGIDGIIRRYCRKSKNCYQITDSKNKDTDINTISYYFFINRFYKYVDDYIPIVFFCNFNNDNIQ